MSSNARVIYQGIILFADCFLPLFESSHYASAVCVNQVGLHCVPFAVGMCPQGLCTYLCAHHECVLWGSRDPFELTVIHIMCCIMLGFHTSSRSPAHRVLWHSTLCYSFPCTTALQWKL
jgi:hypothetical protein